jgi:aryl-alcohol dehydrogenase-like predicted oxidoreductase
LNTCGVHILRYIVLHKTNLNILMGNLWSEPLNKPLGMGFMTETCPLRASRLIRFALTKTVPEQKLLINTAHIYGNGQANEKVLGQALALLTSEERGHLIIVTKIGLEKIIIECESDDHSLVSPDISMYSGARELSIQWEESKHNLGIDTCPEIELTCILHRMNPCPVMASEQREFLLYLTETENVTVGLSEVSLESLAQTVCYLNSNGQSLRYLETEFSMCVPFLKTAGYLEYCKDQEIHVIAYSPTGRGLLTDKYSPWNLPTDLFRSNVLEVWKPDNYLKAWPYLQKIRATARIEGMGTTACYAISWVASHDGVIPIPGYSSEEQFEQNIDAQMIRIPLYIHDKLAFDLRNLGIKRYL